MLPSERENEGEREKEREEAKTEKENGWLARRDEDSRVVSET